MHMFSILKIFQTIFFKFTLKNNVSLLFSYKNYESYCIHKSFIRSSECRARNQQSLVVFCIYKFCFDDHDIKCSHKFAFLPSGNIGILMAASNFKPCANVLLNDLRELEVKRIIYKTVNLKVYTSHYSDKNAFSL